MPRLRRAGLETFGGGCRWFGIAANDGVDTRSLPRLPGIRAALSARMDPEDLREVISAYQKCVAETVRRFGGFVAKYMGDGVLIYFGYPQAHEDDAERAVRAGLELVAAVSSLKTHAPLQTRVGIATGLVVVGDLIGSGASQEQAIVGETPNLAARVAGRCRAEQRGDCGEHPQARGQPIRA